LPAGACPDRRLLWRNWLRFDHHDGSNHHHSINHDRSPDNYGWHHNYECGNDDDSQFRHWWFNG
jgi:hypothetical protein